MNKLLLGFLVFAAMTGLASHNAFGVVICDNPYEYTITTQPVGGTVPVGGSWTFSVEFVSTQPPPHYFQWWRDSTPIPGATSSSLVIDPVTVDDAGFYSVRVYGSGVACGSATSNPAELKLGFSVTLLCNSQYYLEVGRPLTLDVDVVGAVGNVTYQWVHDDVDIPGATAAEYVLLSVTESDAGTYFCRVNDESKATVESARIEVAVFPAGSLPAAGLGGLLVIAASLLGAGFYAARQRRRARS